MFNVNYKSLIYLVNNLLEYCHFWYNFSCR